MGSFRIKYANGGAVYRDESGQYIEISPGALGMVTTTIYPSAAEVAALEAIDSGSIANMGQTITAVR